MAKIGMLFVHGIGEQKRFEHLRSSVREFAELIRIAEEKQGRADSGYSPRQIAVVDRTPGWQDPPDKPGFGPSAPAPVTLTIKQGRDVTTVECHEVWWADLGVKESLFEKIGFWIWGLGQWGAPIFRDIDPAGVADPTDLDDKSQQRPPRVQLPPSSAGEFWFETTVRWRLAISGLTAILTLLSWHLAKKLFSWLANAPSTTLIFQYVGDVRTYERRATPNQSPVSDPGHPLRVPIRRRMMGEMIAMGSRDYDRWYVCAHSLGTVVAYNGLTELSHTLPNYLSQESWIQVPERLKNRAHVLFRPKAEIGSMMPARPAWLGYRAVVNRAALFENFHGLLTYGSPLDKFSAIWPRIVATADDYCDPDKPGDTKPFGTQCHWVNLTTANDPVSGVLDDYSGQTMSRLLPPLSNVVVPSGIDAGLSHIRYFRSGERTVEGIRYQQRVATIRWMLPELTGDAAMPPPAHPQIPSRMPSIEEASSDPEQRARRKRLRAIVFSHLCGAWLLYLAIVCSLALGAGFLIWSAENAASALETKIEKSIAEPTAKRISAELKRHSQPDSADAAGATQAAAIEGEDDAASDGPPSSPFTTKLWHWIKSLPRLIWGHGYPGAVLLGLAIALWAVVGAGLMRWTGEGLLNVRLAEFDGKDSRIQRVLRWQRGAAIGWAASAATLFVMAATVEVRFDKLIPDAPFFFVMMALATLLGAAATQSIVNTAAFGARIRWLAIFGFAVVVILSLYALVCDFREDWWPGRLPLPPYRGVSTMLSLGAGAFLLSRLDRLRLWARHDLVEPRGGDDSADGRFPRDAPAARTDGPAP